MSIHKDVVNDVTRPRAVAIPVPGSFVDGLVPEPSVGDKKLVVGTEVK